VIGDISKEYELRALLRVAHGVHLKSKEHDMTRMNWEKAKQRDRYRGNSVKFESSTEKRATEKQILTIFKNKMVESISTEMTVLEAQLIISAYAAEHWTAKQA